MSSSSSGSGLPRSGTYPSDISSLKSAPWKKCSVCAGQYVFKTPRSFTQHLRDFHCTREGGSFVCHYGMNGVCTSLPLEGVSDGDYEDHIARDHVSTSSLNSASSESNVYGKSVVIGASNPSACSQPAVVEDQHKWTIFHSEVNLPAALNDPRLSKRDNDFFSKTWGDSFYKSKIYPSPYLSDVTVNNFEKYIQKNGSRLRKHKKVMAWVESCQEERNSVLPTDAFPSLVHARRRETVKVDLEQVPKLFLQQSFSLDNPDTFNQVFPWGKLETGALGTKGKSTHSSKLLQEKMSHYLDVIEQQIACQISAKSNAFFHAMTSHDELNSHMVQTLSAIKCLRDRIHNLDQVLVKGSLKIMKLARSRSNYVDVFNKLNLMSTVHQTQPTIQMLLSTCEFVGALDLISTTQEVLNQELSGVTCFRHLGSQLAELEKLIDKMIHSEFSRFITADLNRDIHDTTNTCDEDRLSSILFGLLRQHKVHFIDVYREEASTALKVGIKQSLVEKVSMSSTDLEVDGNVFSLADQMRLLNFTEWMKLLKAVFECVLIILKRVKYFHNILCQVLQVANSSVNPVELENSELAKTELTDAKENGSSSLDESTNPFAEDMDKPGNPFLDDDDDKPGNPFLDDMNESVEETVPVVENRESDAMISAAEYMKVYTGAKEMMGQVSDHAHDRCVKLLMARAKDNFLERLSSSEFVQLSREIEKFAVDCEEICGRKSLSLRGSLQSQANRFVNRFHEERKTKLSLILDSERWKQADVPAEFQQLVRHIHEHDSLTLPEKRTINEVTKPAEALIIGNQRYAVVGTVLMLLKMVIEYCQVVEDIPSATPDILSRLIELLKMFNSRTCQLVLGAGALQLVGLKTITTKNLALAARCLQLIIHHIPLVKAHFQSRLSPKQQTMLKHFDQINKDYNDHVSEVFNQLSVITDSVLDAHLSSWEIKAPVPSSCFRSLCKQLNRLHEALCDIISASELQSLFVKVNESFKKKLLFHLRRLNVPVDGPQNGLLMAELAFYTENLKSLSRFKDFDPCFRDIWENR